MYEAWPQPGGVLLYGIPNFKQNKPAVVRKFEQLRRLGIELVTNTKVGEDIPFDRLHAEHDAVFLGYGATGGARVGIPGEDAPGVYAATDFLVRANLEGDALPPSAREALPPPRRVAVIGGGDTSMDCVRSAVRLGADQVTLIYRRTEREMQGRSEERQHAAEEGVRFEYLATPLEVLLDEGSAVRGIRCQRMRLGEPDDTGRARPEPVPGSEFEVDADMVVIAVGYDVDEAWGETVPEMLRDRWNRAVVDPETMKTSVAGVFAGGDNVNGADLVVTALADGHRAAAAIEQYLADGVW
jgi:glutamate synthase (NADPH/NADH) small chain